MGIFDKISGRVNDIIDEVMIPDDVHRAHETAMAHLADGQADKALQVLKTSAATKPNIARTHYLMGKAHLALGDLEHGVDAFEVSLGIRPQALTHVQLAGVYEALGRAREAEHHYQCALDTDEKGSWRFEAHFGLGRVLLNSGRASKAAKELRRAMAIEATDSVRVTLAEALYQRGEYDDALKLLEDVTGVGVEAVKALLTAKLHEATGQLEQARKAYEDIVEISNNAEALLGAARLNLAHGRAGKADEYARRAADNAPEHQPEAFQIRGAALLKLGRPSEAKTVLEAALAAQANPKTALVLAQVSVELGANEEAIRHFEAAMSGGASTKAEAGLGLAKVRRKASDRAGARLSLLEVIRSSPLPQVSAESHLELAELALENDDPAQAILWVQEGLQIPADASDALNDVRERALEALRPNWRLPDALVDPLSLSDVLDQLIQHAANDVRLTEFVPGIQRVSSQLEAPLSMAIVGEFNAGKSTIVNSLVGESVLPTGVLPTTAHSGILKYGPRKAARVFDMEGGVKEVGLDEAKKLMKTNADAIEHLEFIYPHPALRIVEYWDTPGFNAANERHEEVARRALESAEAILWVMDANQVLSQTEFDLIDNIPDAGERLVVVINKVDRLGNKTQRAKAVGELQEYVEENLDGYILGTFAISALSYWEGDEAAKKDSGFEEFVEFVDSQIVDRAGRIKLVEGRRNLQSLLDGLCEFRDGLAATTAAHLEAVENLRNWLHEEAAASNERAMALVRSLDDQLDFMLAGIESEIMEAMRPSTSIINSKLHLTDDDKRFLLELVEERLASVLQHALQQQLEDLNQLESAIAQGFDPIFRGLSVMDTRAMQGRLDGFFDESQTLQRLLEDRVYGQIRAETRGRVAASGDEVLNSIVVAQSDKGSWRVILRRLVPRLDVGMALTQWYVEYFENAFRLLVRARADLELTRLEARYRYDYSGLLQLVAKDSHLPT